MQIVIFILSIIVLGILALILGNYLGEKLQDHFNQGDKEERIKDARLLIALRVEAEQLISEKRCNEISNVKYNHDMKKIIEQVERLESKYSIYDE